MNRCPKLALVGVLALVGLGVATRQPARAGCVSPKQTSLKLVSATEAGAPISGKYEGSVLMTSWEGGVVEITARPSSTPFWRESYHRVPPTPAP